MRYLLAVTMFCCLSFLAVAADDKKEGSDDTPKAAATRKILKEKISVDFKDTRLADAVDELKDALKEKKKIVSILLDVKGGVSRNRTLTYKGDEEPLDKILEGMFKKVGLTYTIISAKNNAYDGSILIKQK